MVFLIVVVLWLLCGWFSWLLYVKEISHNEPIVLAFALVAGPCSLLSAIICMATMK